MNLFKHFKIITIHKYYVLCECFKRKLYLQGLVHDLSKYSFAEFISSAKYFQGDKTPIEAEKAAIGYSFAWLNHKAKNKHHWQYWIDIEKGELLMAKIPRKYILEMVCDLIGASKAYLKGKYSPKEPYEYFKKNKNYFLMEKESKEILEKELKRIL